MGRWSNIVRVSAPSRLGDNEIHRIFSAVGKVHALHPYERGSSDKDTDTKQTFIEFSQDSGATNALALHLVSPNLHVRSLDGDPVLLEQYRMAMAVTRRGAVRDPPAQPDQHGALPSPSSVELIQPEVGSSLSLQFAPETASSSDANNQGAASNPSASINASKPPLTPITTNGTGVESTVVPSQLDAGSNKSQPSPVVAFSLDAQISVAFHGETFCYDLNIVQNDHQPIIELLKLSSGDPGTWMTAAAYYRRNGNPKNSMAVLTAMIDSMKQLNIQEEHLRPVYLMLSGCETDLAKSAKTQAVVDQVIVAQHYEQSKTWLQKVYGIDIPGQSTNANPKYPVPNSQPSQPAPQNNTNLPSPSQTQTPTHIPKSLPLRLRLDPENIPPLIIEDTCPLDARGPNNGPLLAVQRAKRRLEEDCIHEREQRRRLERELKAVTRERDVALRTGDRMRLIIKDEYDGRKKAEAALKKETEKRLAIPSIETLAQILHRAAQAGEEASRTPEKR
ncbi:hypothetical protein ONZ45_g18540 [Pleurotus djamor]|nr:hypothetical protein ONZ45_g18540 [Pleurotus djamor]